MGHKSGYRQIMMTFDCLSVLTKLSESSHFLACCSKPPQLGLDDRQRAE